MSGDAPKGDVLATARIAGIMAAKRTSELIPLCHPLALSHAGIEFTPLPDQYAFHIVASAKTTGPTGVEMEALTAVSVAALTVYDMVKAVDRSAHIESMRIVSKSGGKSGSFEPRAEKEKEKTKAKPALPAPRPTGRARAMPQVLVHEVASPRVALDATKDREAFREFMISQRLRVTDWAKTAKVPVGELYGFLSGRSRSLSPDTSEKLARAARSSVDTMFGRKSR